MKLEIEFNKITDAPYHKDLSSFFNFTPTEVEALVNLISKMNESCYYLSGFRGVGKTSFIKKVEEELSKVNGFIFIHVPISKFDKYEIIIRSLIRRFYFQFVANKQYETQEEIKNNSATGKLVLSLTKLNKETFSSLSNEKIVINKTEKNKTTILVDYKAEILMFLAVITTFVMFSIDFKVGVYEIIAKLMPLCWTILQGVNLVKKRTTQINSSRHHSESEKSLYDDEIVEYKFVSLLEEFKSVGIKPVFILDELDKLEIEDAKKVLYLFKSTMLSGHANFIVVGGQDLYYELYSANESEDPILSTLFSKTVHVPLKSSSELRDLFRKLILNYEIVETEDQRIAYDQFVNRLVIESRRIPRKFFNLIKNEIFFEKGKAFINIPEEYNRPSHTELLSILDSVTDNIPHYPQPIKDYIALNLFQHTDKLLNITNEEDLNTYINTLK